MKRNTSLDNQKKIQSEQTRQQIIEAATRLFARKGFYGTTISDLTQAVGLTKGALYYHFKDKDDIFFAVVESVRRIWEQSVGEQVENAGNTATLEQMSLLFEKHAAMISENEFMCLVMSNLMNEMESVNPKFALVLEEIYEDFIRFVENLVLLGQSKGEIRKDIDPLLLSLNIVGILKGIGCYPKLKSIPIDRRAMAKCVLEALLEGIKA